MVGVSLATGDPQSHCPAAALIQVLHLGLVTAWFYGQCSGCCYASLFCEGVITITWWAGSLGPSRLARKGAIGLAPGSLEADREGKKKSVWFVYLVHRTFRA